MCRGWPRRRDAPAVRSDLREPRIARRRPLSVDETALVARARQVDLSDDVVERSFANLEAIARGAPAAYPSLYEDIVHGRPIELEALNGAVVRMGRESGIPTPVSSCIAALLSPYLTGTPPLL